jgi:hypothetical protein
MIRTFIVVCSLLLCGCTRSNLQTKAPETPDWPTAAAAPAECRVKISWKAETETDAFGYLVFRGATADSLACLNQNDPLHAGGTTTIPAQYRYYDRDVVCGQQYFYRVAAVDMTGKQKWIIGDHAPVAVAAKPLSAEEQQDIKDHGARYRIEETAAPESADAPPALLPR